MCGWMIGCEWMGIGVCVWGIDGLVGVGLCVCVREEVGMCGGGWMVGCVGVVGGGLGGCGVGIHLIPIAPHNTPGPSSGDSIQRLKSPVPIPFHLAKYIDDASFQHEDFNASSAATLRARVRMGGGRGGGREGGLGGWEDGRRREGGREGGEVRRGEERREGGREVRREEKEGGR